MSKNDRDFQLDYFVEYPLGGNPTTSQQKRVRLKVGNIADLERRLYAFGHNVFAWKHAQRIEGREGVEDNEGIWPLNFWRSERFFGNPGADLFPQEMELNAASAEVIRAGQETRVLGYFRVRNSSDARKLLNEGKEVRYSSEITNDWYNPPKGIIKVPNGDRSIVGSHAVPLDSISRQEEELFCFQNSWGGSWGEDGRGAITPAHFDRFIIEAWSSFGMGLFPPYSLKEGIVCLEWKWSINDSFGVYGREIIEGASSKRLAWSFCVKRDGYLDVEEFFVWPIERGRGYGRALADMVKKLATSLRLPLRMLVSYADTVEDNAENLNAAGRLLGLTIVDSNERWIHKIGMESPPAVHRAFSRPMRPAVMLERLRPKDEKPVDGPIEYSVYFGTNRDLVIDDEVDGIEFGSTRSSSLFLGQATVTIPRTHRFGSKGSMWIQFCNWWSNRNRNRSHLGG